jgi:hypothetical protein
MWRYLLVSTGAGDGGRVAEVRTYSLLDALEQRIRAETLAEKLSGFQTRVPLDTPSLYRVESCAETRNGRKRK